MITYFYDHTLWNSIVSVLSWVGSERIQPPFSCYARWGPMLVLPRVLTAVGRWAVEGNNVWTVTAIDPSSMLHSSHHFQDKAGDENYDVCVARECLCVMDPLCDTRKWRVVGSLLCGCQSVCAGNSGISVSPVTAAPWIIKGHKVIRGNRRVTFCNFGETVTGISVQWVLCKGASVSSVHLLNASRE